MLKTITADYISGRVEKSIGCVYVSVSASASSSFGLDIWHGGSF